MDELRARAISGVIRVALGLLLLSPAPSAGQEQQPSWIELGGVRLESGMDKRDALEDLGLTYDLQFVEGSTDHWMVRRRDAARTTIGSVGFSEDESLAIVNKKWDTNNDTSEALFRAFFLAVESVTERAGSSSVATAQTYRTTSPPTRILDLVCGRHTVSLSENGVSEVLWAL